MHHKEDAGEVQNGGQDGGNDDGSIGDAGDLRHKEGGGAHDGRHDLTAGGSGGLHCCGKFRLIAHLFHGGDGDAAAADGIGDGGAGIHSLQGAGDNGDLGGAAHAGTRDGVCQIHEEGADAGLFEEGAEDDKQHDKGGADGDGGGEDAAIEVIEQVVDEIAQGGLWVIIGEPPRPVDGEQPHHHDQRDAGGTAAQLHQQQDADDADDDLGGADAVCHLDDLFLHDGIVEKDDERGERQQDIIPREVVIPQGVPLAGGVFQVADKQRHAHKNGQAGVLRRTGNDQRHHDHGDGIEDEQHRHGGFPAAGQAAAFAVTVQLLQKLCGVGPIGVVMQMVHRAASFLGGMGFTGSQRGVGGGTALSPGKMGKAAAGGWRSPAAGKGG